MVYNRMRGQYMSALEHAIPECFFNDPTQCNPVGMTTPISGLPSCPQGISALKAIALGAQAGQKIFKITALVYQDNPNIVNTSLFAHSQSTKDRIQQALDAGYEVTIHEAPVAQDDWTGAGFTMIDPTTGAGGYIIDGGSNGGFLNWWTRSKDGVTSNGTIIGLVFGLTSLVAVFVTALPLVLFLALFFISMFISFINMLTLDLQGLENSCPGAGKVGVGLEITAFVTGFFRAGGVALGTWISFLVGGAVGSAVARCGK